MSQCYEFNYTSNQPQLLPDVWVPCPVGDNCCIGTDLCLSNHVCHHVSSSSKRKRDASYSGYYNARCTDPTYTSPACDKICIGWPPDIVYNYTSDLWACCGNNTAGQVTCSNPLHEYYEAPAPNQLATLSSGATFPSSQTLTPYTSITASSTINVVAGTATSTSSTISANATTSASTSTPVSVISQASGLSSGAEAGIGVGVALAILSLVVAVLFWIRRRSRKRRRADLSARRIETHDEKLVEKRRMPSELPGFGHERTAELDPKVYKLPVELDQG